MRPLRLDWSVYSPAAIARDLGLDEATVCRYAQTCQLPGLAGYLRTEQPGYWGLLKTAVLNFLDLLPGFGPELASCVRFKFQVLDSQTTS